MAGGGAGEGAEPLGAAGRGKECVPHSDRLRGAAAAGAAELTPLGSHNLGVGRGRRSQRGSAEGRTRASGIPSGIRLPERSEQPGGLPALRGCDCAYGGHGLALPGAC